MADRIGDRQSVILQQALHGYSDGHRLLASSIELGNRDAKTALMMSDASGPAATIGEEGYLTAYPLSEGGCYAIARTWPAPEMSRPGCVWTHTIFIDFSDIPTLESAMGLIALFRRPKGDAQSYASELAYAWNDHCPSTLDEDVAREVLYTLYTYPSKPVISSRLEQCERDSLALAVWDQQWPRLKRSFRFCTLSFADRTTNLGPFDLQFLPDNRSIPRAQFKSAVDADRQDVDISDWLRDAISDLFQGSTGSLRRFLREAGSDLGGRESFEPLARLHSISLRIGKDQSSVEQAILLLNEAMPESQGLAARTLITRSAAENAESLSADGLQFVLHYYDLLRPSEAAAVAERVGRTLWNADPSALMNLSQDPVRSIIAMRAIASLPTSTLLEGASSVPQSLGLLVDSRPELANQPGFWSLPFAWDRTTVAQVANRTTNPEKVVDAMLRSQRPSISVARDAFGSELILRRLAALLDDRTSTAFTPELGWLAEACSDAEVLAGLLAEGAVSQVSTLDAIAHASTPDFVPNEFGKDPWLLAIKDPKGMRETPYLASFLFARGLGRYSRNPAELIQYGFDSVYLAAENSTLPNEAWGLLDSRLAWSYFWPYWDRCLRLRETVVDVFVARQFDESLFARLTSREDVFASLVTTASGSRKGRRYLKSVRETLRDEPSLRNRLYIVQDALW